MIEWTKCTLCGKIEWCDDHHVIPRARYQETDIIKLGRFCHSDVHNLNNEAFLKKYGKKRSKFIKVKEIKNGKGKM